VKALRERLLACEPLLCTFITIPSPVVVELAALAGFDAVVLDTEHGPYGVESLPALLLAARAHGIAAIVRVRSHDPSLIGLALDAGADGVLVPHVSSASEAQAVVAAARFAPDGHRGANPFVAAAGYSGRSDWFTQANRSVAVIGMVEGKEGLDAVNEILDVAGLDAVFVGPFDLSHALGLPGQVDHPAVTASLLRVAEEARMRGRAMGAFAPTTEAVRSLQDAGAALIAYGVDTMLVLDCLRARVEEVRSCSTSPT